MMRTTRQAVSETNSAIDVAWLSVAAFLKPEPESYSESGGSGVYIGSWKQKLKKLWPNNWQLFLTKPVSSLNLIFVKAVSWQVCLIMSFSILEVSPLYLWKLILICYRISVLPAFKFYNCFSHQITVAQVLVRTAADVGRIQMRYQAAATLHKPGFFRRQTSVSSFRTDFIGVRIGDHFDGRETFWSGFGLTSAAQLGRGVRAVAVAITCQAVC